MDPLLADGAARLAPAHDLVRLFVDLCDAMLVIGHDGARVHAELSMSFDLHERLVQLWDDLCEP